MTTELFRIATWNILGRRVARTKEIAEDGAVKRLLAEHPVDVLCLQEVHFYDREAEGQLVDELSDVGLEHSVWLPLSESHLDAAANLGVGIASKEPLVRQENFCLSNPGLRASVRGQQWVLHDKGMVGCTVEMPSKPIQVYSLHLFPFHEFGVGEDDHQVRDMWIEFWRYADGLAARDKLVLAGDFNQQRRERAARRWSAKPWRFCIRNTVTTSFGLSLDDLALNWEPSSTTVRSVPTFSDHHLAVAEIAV